MALLVAGVGALVGGGVEAVASARSGASGIDVLKAFGRGAVSGGVASGAAIVTGIATGNPYLIGASAGMTYDMVDQLIGNGFRLERLNTGSLAFNTVLGAALGPISSRLPGLRLRGPTPDLFQPRTLSRLGPNSLRLLGQEALGGFLGGFFDLFDLSCTGSE